MNISETPNKWVILKIIVNKETFHKVFATWSGGYLDGDRWRINSGIKGVEQDDYNYYFIGYSGSCYKCNKNSYGTITFLGKSVLNKLLKKEEVSLMENVSDWGKELKK